MINVMFVNAETVKTENPLNCARTVLAQIHHTKP